MATQNCSVRRYKNRLRLLQIICRLVKAYTYARDQIQSDDNWRYDEKWGYGLAIPSTEACFQSVQLPLQTPAIIYSFLLWGGLSPFGPSAAVWTTVSAPDQGWWWLCSSRWNEWRGKPLYAEETWSSAALSITNPTWLDPGLELEPPRWEAGGCLSYCMVLTSIFMCDKSCRQVIYIPWQ
jgi:hypothetical protein